MTGRPPSGRPLRTKTVKILVTPELDAAVTAAAKREGRSVSDWGQRLFEREVTRAQSQSARLPLMLPEQQGRMFEHDREIEAVSRRAAASLATKRRGQTATPKIPKAR